MRRNRADFRVGDIVRFAKQYRYTSNAKARFRIIDVRPGRVDVAHVLVTHVVAHDIVRGLSPTIFELADEWDD